MPRTELIPHDCDDEALIPDLLLTPSSASPSPQWLLKAPLGSGGDSLYFVSSKCDALAIMRAHRVKAENTPGFLEGLRADYGGSVPSWSLQSIIPSVVLSNERKCQVRAYVIYCDSELYLYTDYEVRQPMWIKSDDDETLAENLTTESSENMSPSLQADIEFCSNCINGARPYNFRRSKTHTERMMISEVDGMLSEESTREKITEVMLSAFRALKPKILSESLHPLEANREILRNKSSLPPSSVSNSSEVNNTNKDETFSNSLETVSYNQSIAEMAIIGADLIIEEKTMQPYIVEINNNPAMPAPHKTMTETYRDHLMEFVASLISLGIGAAAGKHDASSPPVPSNLQQLRLMHIE
jgi:hypothetical protein